MTPPFKIAIGADHAGYKLKQQIIGHLESKGVEVEDFGTDSAESVDYPDFAHAVAEAVSGKEGTLGILICGTANGIAMAANKHAGIRAGIAWAESIARLARTHNDANILCLPARWVAPQLAFDCVDAFLAAEFEGGRHARRVGKIPC